MVHTAAIGFHSCQVLAIAALQIDDAALPLEQVQLHGVHQLPRQQTSAQVSVTLESMSVSISCYNRLEVLQLGLKL